MELADELKELKVLVKVLVARIEVLEQENAVLKAENAEFRARLGMNSSNSNKPPSTDGLSKKPSPALPKASGKKSGAQPGHAGKSLQMVAKADEIILHHAPYCPCCMKVFTAS